MPTTTKGVPPEIPTGGALITKTTEHKVVAPQDEESTNRGLLPEGFWPGLRDAALLRPRPGTLREHLRPQIHPWRWGAAVAGLGAAQHAVWLETPPTLASTLAVAGGSLLGARWVRRWLAKRGKKRFDLAHDWVTREPGHAKVCGWTAAGWLTMAHLIDPATPLAWALTYGTFGVPPLVAVSSRFWRHHRPEPILAAPEPAAPPPPEEGEHPLARTWRTYVGSANKALPGSRLKSVVRDGVFHEALLQLNRGVQDIETVRGALPRIASGMGIPASGIVVEERESTEEEPEPDPAVLRIRFASSSAVTKTVPLAGQRYLREGDAGLVRLGSYVDGDGEPTARMYSKNSIWGGYAVGATGTGKSTLLDNLALAAWQSGHTVVFYIDGAKDGGSSPRIFERADWAVGANPHQWDAMLSGLEHLIAVRNTENRRRLGTSGFTPSPERPGVIVIIDESHKVVTAHKPPREEGEEPARDTFAKRWGYVAREGRSAGVAVWMASQIFSLEAFGGDNSVRGSITAGNTIALRVDANESSMIKDVPLKPWRLPKGIPGLALLDEGRETTIRCAWAEDEHTAAMMDAALPTAARLDRLAEAALDEGSSGAYSRRYEIAEQANVEADALLERLEAGIVDLLPRPTPTSGSAGVPDLDALPDVDLSVLAPPDPAQGRTGLDATILRLLHEHGPMARAELEEAIAEHSSQGRTTIHRALDRLRDEGAVTNPKRGVWALIRHAE